MRPLRVAVVGAGHMGRRHAEKVAALRDAEGRVALAGIADIDLARARRVASATATQAVADPGELFGEADAAIVAVPTSQHFDLVSAAFERGLDVLVEKPLAANLEEGEEMLALARRAGRVLQVGHQERFNAAVRVMREKIRAPRFIEAQRMGPFSERATDVDVVRDLMIHDLDILQELLGEEPEHVDAIGVPIVTEQVDIANARIAFPCGCIASLTASRVAATPMRKLRFFQRDGTFSIDLLAQSASVFRRRPAAGNGEADVSVDRFTIDPDDALLAQLRAFLEAVETRDASEASGADALRALRTALRVVKAMPPVSKRP